MAGKGELIMTARESKKFIKEIKAINKQLTAENSKELLIKAGICTPEGKLTKPYK